MLWLPFAWQLNRYYDVVEILLVHHCLPAPPNLRRQETAMYFKDDWCTNLGDEWLRLKIQRSHLKSVDVSRVRGKCLEGCPHQPWDSQMASQIQLTTLTSPPTCCDYFARSLEQHAVTSAQVLHFVAQYFAAWTVHTWSMSLSFAMDLGLIDIIYD